MMSDVGVKIIIRLMTDSTAALGISKRRGIGKVRHIELNQLWLQEKVSGGDIEVKKVKGTENIADALTTYLDQEGLRWHNEKIGLSREEGIHDIAPE